MRAVIFEQVNDPLVVCEVEPVALGPNDVRIVTGSSGVCHSDLSYVKGLHAPAAPIVLGHEGAGRVVEVGSAVSAVRPGDRVITSWASFCGHCYQCVHGRGHLCELQPSLATQSRALQGGVAIPAMTGVGSMAELMTVHETKVVRVDTDLPDEQLALIGCAVTTGVGAALWTAGVKAGSTVAIFGCGGVGQAAIQGAHLASAARIIAIDPVPLKREAALRLGATEAVDPLSADAVEQVCELTGGRGAEYTFDAAGRVDTMRQAFEAACPGGTVTFVGGPQSGLELALPANLMRSQGKRILGSHYGSAQIHRDMPRLVKLAEVGRLDIAEMVSRRLPLGDVDAALAVIESGDVIRCVLDPSA